MTTSSQISRASNLIVLAESEIRQEMFYTKTDFKDLRF